MKLRNLLIFGVMVIVAVVAYNRIVQPLAPNVLPSLS